MPTPVSTARQCLTEEAAGALDDAVAVARRRSHAQTTSLHAVSALLALPSSTLREACARARSSAYSPRLQFRALELCVGVSLDRLPTTKALDDHPPIANSLMAAIKRSQANQRRHPDTFHLYQQLHYHHHNNNFQSNSSSSSPPSISTVKVELRHFILSILDDPSVSRVFGEAGFRSCDIKLAILNPPTISRFSRTRCPPLFLCNFSDSELSKRGFSFPFPGVLDSETSNENSRRIGEVLVKKTAKNPLLVGFCANDAFTEFLDCINKAKTGVLPPEIDGLSLVSVEKEICEFLDKGGGGGGEELLGLKFKEVNDLIDGCKGPGVVINYGDLKVLLDHGESVEAANHVVSRLSKMVEVHCGKLWLIGVTSSYDTFMKFSTRFPSIEKDWDLHLLPITSSRTPTGLYSKSSLIGSFVPFGGFFPSASDFESPTMKKNQSSGRCNACNEKYEQEASSVLKGESSGSVADRCSSNLSPWLQMAEGNKSKRLSTEEVSDDQSILSVKLMGLEKKWNEICHRLHRSWCLQQNVSCSAKSQVSDLHASPFTSERSESSNSDLLREKGMFSVPTSCMLSDFSRNSLPKPNILEPVPLNTAINPQAEVSMHGLRTGNFWNPSHAVGNLSLPHDHASSSSITSVTTDLGLGTIFASSVDEPNKTKFQDHKDRLSKFSQGSVSADTSSGNASNQVGRSSCSSVPELRHQSDGSDFKFLLRVLSEKISWQDEALYAISETVAFCRSGNGRRRGSRIGSIWLSFSGPDKVGKRKIAIALAEAIFGSKLNLLRVDFASVDKGSCSSTLVDRQDLRSNDRKFRGKTIVDYIAEELCKKPQSVVLLENIDKADFIVQNSMSQAMRNGKFPDSHGREISIGNAIFVITSRESKVFKEVPSEKLDVEYPEERILAARDHDMQILVGHASGDATKISDTNVVTVETRGNRAALAFGKRKLIDDVESSMTHKLQRPKRARESSRSCLDLNLPVEELEEEEEEEDDCDTNSNKSDSGSESSKAWLEEFLDQVDRDVFFKPFDFNALSHKVLRDISLRFQQTVGSNYLLEIDSDVVAQILAASWLSEAKKSLEDWIDEVLCSSFKEALKRYHLSPSVHVIKLIPCQSLVENHAPGICLPAKITVN